MARRYSTDWILVHSDRVGLATRRLQAAATASPRTSGGMASAMVSGAIKVSSSIRTMMSWVALETPWLTATLAAYSSARVFTE
jgi:hypothetical protein